MDNNLIETLNVIKNRLFKILPNLRFIYNESKIYGENRYIEVINAIMFDSEIKYHIVTITNSDYCDEFKKLNDSILYRVERDDESIKIKWRTSRLRKKLKSNEVIKSKKKI